MVYNLYLLVNDLYRFLNIFLRLFNLVIKHCRSYHSQPSLFLASVISFADVISYLLCLSILVFLSYPHITCVLFITIFQCFIAETLCNYCFEMRYTNKVQILFYTLSNPIFVVYWTLLNNKYLGSFHRGYYTCHSRKAQV